MSGVDITETVFPLLVVDVFGINWLVLYLQKAWSQNFQFFMDKTLVLNPKVGMFFFFTLVYLFLIKVFL